MPAPYQVDYSGAILAELKELQARARELGQEKQFLRALQQIDAELRASPSEFGDPAFTLPFAKIKIRHEIVRPILVYLGVHEESSKVIIKSVELWPTVPKPGPP